MRFACGPPNWYISQSQGNFASFNRDFPEKLPDRDFYVASAGDLDTIIAAGKFRRGSLEMYLRRGGGIMNSQVAMEPIQNVDGVEEFRLRTWARRNYIPVEGRGLSLHPVVVDELSRMDEEQKFRKSPK
jgi:hypothetical protein